MKLLALDVDGTLLDSKHVLRPITIEAVQRVRNQGVHTIIATGKSHRAAQPVLDALQLKGPQITSGGHITDAETGATLYDARLSMDIVEQVVAISADLGITAIPIRDGATYALSHNRDTAYMQSYGDPEPIIIDDLLSITEPHLIQLIAYGNDRGYAAVARRLVGAVGEWALVTRSSPYFLEVSPLNISKGQALEQLCKMINIPLAETTAIGDSYNDISMFQVAGFSIAMGHSPAELKAIANAVTLGNDQDGVAHALDRHFPVP